MTHRTSRRRVHLNGKWLSRSMTGTERYANEVVRELVTGRLLTGTVILHVPRDTVVPPWLSEACQVVRHRSRGLLFEQFVLPWATRGEPLVNLAGPAPLAKTRQLVVMHDATFLVWPQGFSRRFVVWYRLMYMLLSRTAQHLVTVSTFSRSELARLLGVPEQRFALAPCGHEHVLGLVAAEPTLPAELDRDAPFLVCVGTLARHKNVLGPARKLAEAGWQVLLVGAGGPSRIFASTAEPLPDKVTVMGRITDAELAWCYDHALALVFPSRYEGFGLPVLEAQSRGCAVIASGAASLPEVMGEGGLSFDPDDDAQLLDAAVLLRDDASLRSDLVAAGSANLGRFRWRRAAEVVASLVQAPTDRPGRPLR